ncbi:PREDICTED: enhancer of rudimentary homolog isoform X3 [Theobroma cacao]|uniref:Enhancer of rudimentary homolog isoform X3 n=1 Tax=Theobroma cacao TaxID=3641 RepID=A0AB32X2F3_THECC|nr:PREDICTED: enhancer of rudimentary homolog isoform X3 [Theobroma cacao]
MQTSQNRAPRTFVDYDSISQAMDGIRGLYERKLKKLNPATQNITYDIGVLYNFIDGLADMIALAYDSLSLPPPFSGLLCRLLFQIKPGLQFLLCWYTGWRSMGRLVCLRML